FASGARSHHCGKERERAIRGTGVDADARVFGHVREAVLVSRDGYLPGPRVVRDPVLGMSLYGPVAPYPEIVQNTMRGFTTRRSSYPSPRLASAPGRIASMTASAPRTRSR